MFAQFLEDARKEATTALTNMFDEFAEINLKTYLEDTAVWIGYTKDPHVTLQLLLFQEELCPDGEGVKVQFRDLFVNVEDNARQNIAQGRTDQTEIEDVIVALRAEASRLEAIIK